MAQAKPNFDRETKPVQTIEVEHLENKLTGLYQQLENLVETQLELAKTELSEKIQQVKKGAGSMTMGSALAFYGGQAIILGLVLLVNQWIGTLWISALIVGAVIALFGIIMMMSGKKSLKPEHLKPEKSMRSFREDAEAVTRRTR